MEKLSDILKKLDEMFPDAKCELNYHNLYELVIDVMLSAQTTDTRVNIVNVELFNKYKDICSLSQANMNDVLNIISSLGLAKTKAKNIIEMSKIVVNNYNGIIPSDFNTLITLPGIGRKTANVIMSEGFKLPGLAVDTHVARVAQRLGLTINDNVEKIEEDLKNSIPKTQWSNAHIKLLFFGRYFCKAQNPNCNKCIFKCYKK